MTHIYTIASVFRALKPVVFLLGEEKRRGEKNLNYSY